MTSGPRSALLRQFRALFESGPVAGLTDGQLLERFLTTRGEAGEVAFAALVARHGPMVLGVCRRALPDPNDAADAFQATFLVLVKKAGSVRVDDSLGRWLYGVSRRVAGRARTIAARRPRGEVALERIEADSPDPDRFELASMIDEELARLPEAFRSAIVLCDLGGMTHEEAARDLLCPVGTIKSRLARGRKRLRERLERRGLTPSTMMLAPTVPASLADAAVRVSTIAMTSGTMAAGVVPASVAALTQEVLKAMIGIKLKLAAAVVLSLGVVATGAGVLGQAQKGDEKSPTDAARQIAKDEARLEAEPASVESKAAQKANELAIESFPKGHWATEKDLKLTYYDAIRGFYMYGQNYERLNDGKQILISPFALIWGSKDGKSRKTLTSDKAIIDFSQPFGLVKQEAGPSRVTHSKLFGDVRLRDGSLELRADDLQGGFLSSIEFDGAPEPLKAAPAANPGRKIWPKGGLVGDPPGELSKVAMPDYVIEPPDIILVEVLEALQGRPITGERLVKPDGKISLGFYGEVYVAGLTTTEVKAKVALHLREFVDDEKLGLSRTDPETGKVRRIDPDRTDRIFVDVASYNSKVYYVQGDVGVPGRLPVTGNETVLDAINYAGGLIPTASKTKIILVRPSLPGKKGELTLPVDLDAIVSKGDVTTNYQILPGDRLIVHRDPKYVLEEAPKSKPEVTDPPDVEARLQTLEKKLDEVLKALERLPKP